MPNNLPQYRQQTLAVVIAGRKTAQAGSQALNVEGIVLSDEIKGGSGSALTLCLRLPADGDTGMYSAGTNALFTTGGTSRGKISPDGDPGTTGQHHA